MQVQLGNLTFLQATEHAGLMAAPVAAALSLTPGAEVVGVADIDPALSDTAAFCERYAVGPELAANCVIVEGKRGEERVYAACVLLATTRADVNGVVRTFLDVRKVSFAPRELAVEKSGMEFGAITPVGLPADWPILIDAAVATSGYVIVGSGKRASKLAITGAVLATLPNAHVVKGLGVAKGQL